MTKQEKETLISWYKERTSNLGDDYYAGEKNGRYYVGYSNDYPLQHGHGERYWPNEIELKEAGL